jgi:hypothetical protein
VDSQLNEKLELFIRLVVEILHRKSAGGEES